jgi:hypothetical protein
MKERDTMPIHTARSLETDSKAAASALAEQLGPHAPELVLFFTSSTHEPAVFAAELARGLGQVSCIGCTTAGELVDDVMLSHAAVAMGLGRDVVAGCRVAAVEDPSDPASAKAALDRLAEGFAQTPSELDHRRFVGIVLQDGMSVNEETVMDALSTLTNVPFIGGSAGDDLAFQRTFVYLNGEARTGQCALALLELQKPYEILKTQSFDVRDETLEVTQADEATRTVLAFNGKPATIAYAEALGCTVEELPSRFQSNPLGLVTAAGDPFVRSPQQIKGDQVVFYCQIKEGMKLQVLESRDIVSDTRRDLSAKLAEMGGCAGIVNFHCILRTIELQQKGQTEAYGKVFTGTPTVGFSTYGESYIGHINQTSTMLLLRA